MKIELELYSDQSGIDESIQSSSVWIFKLNGDEFPTKDNSLMTLNQAHRLAYKLCDIEELIYKENK